MADKISSSRAVFSQSQQLVNVSNDIVKVIIIILAILVTASGAAFSFHKRNLYIQASLLSEGFTLSEKVKDRVSEFYDDNGALPHDNEQASLPPAHVIFGSSVDRISVVRDGVVLVQFNENLGLSTLSFTPKIDLIQGMVGWSCSSDSIAESVLSKLETECTYIPATPESKLMEYIASQDVAGVREQLNKSLDLEMAISGNTPMMLAARTGNTEILQLLLQGGAAVDHALANTERRTPLMVAISGSKAEAISLLLAEGASIERKDYSGKSALDYARITDARHGDERFELMLAAQFNPLFAGNSASEELIKTPTEIRQEQSEVYAQFEFAIATCHVKRIESILIASDDFSASELVAGSALFNNTQKPDCVSNLSHFLKTKSTWQTAFMAAFENVIDRCEVETANSMLSENPELDLADAGNGESLLFRSIRSGCPDILNLFLRDSRLSGKVDAELLTRTIREVPQSSLLRTVSVLIQSGADVNGTTSTGDTPLLTAIRFEQPVVAKYLVDAGADPNHNVKSGEWPLIEATKKGYYHLVVQLLEGGANANASDELGRTALHAAVGRGLKRVIPVLLRAGADPRLRDRHGIDSIVMASSSRYRNIQTLLTAE